MLPCQWAGSLQPKIRQNFERPIFAPAGCPSHAVLITRDNRELLEKSANRSSDHYIGLLFSVSFSDGIVELGNTYKPTFRLSCLGFLRLPLKQNLCLGEYRLSPFSESCAMSLTDEQLSGDDAACG